MPLVFVHGVATRQTLAYQMEMAQRTALFRALLPVVGDDVRNPDWGSHAVAFSEGLPWLPKPAGNEAYGAAGTLGGRLSLSLGKIAQTDAAAAIDLAIAAMLQARIDAAIQSNQPALATDQKSLDLTRAAAALLDKKAPDEKPCGLNALNAADNDTFAAALESQLKQNGDLQAYGGIGDAIKSGFDTLGNWIGAGLSDAALRAKRADLSRLLAFFLGDIFIYLRQRNVAGPDGTADRLFKPILDDLIAAWSGRQGGEPLVVVGHSLGGVILFDLLTDPDSLARLAAEAPGFNIDLLTTVGSQPGFFADLRLYDGKPGAGGKLDKPSNVSAWHNVFDFTDVFSFLSSPMFNGPEDFEYDTAVDLFAAHTAYFKRPSFYQRLRARLAGLDIA